MSDARTFDPIDFGEPEGQPLEMWAAGSCITTHMRKPGGYSAILRGPSKGCEVRLNGNDLGPTTAPRMELLAFVLPLEALGESPWPLRIYAPDAVSRSVTEWGRQWVANEGHRKKKPKVANWDLLERLFAVVAKQRHSVGWFKPSTAPRWSHVKEDAAELAREGGAGKARAFSGKWFMREGRRVQ